MTMNPDDNQDEVRVWRAGAGHDIAYRQIKGTGSTVLWLGGFKSDMTGTKAQVLADMAVRAGFGFVRFDYFGHGATGGDWNAARVGLWRQDVLEVVDNLTEGPLVVVGSSMGGWMTTLLIKDRPERVKAAGFIAPAPDFTHELMLPNLNPEERRALTVSGAFVMTGYDQDVTMSQAFFDEAKDHLVFGSPLTFDGPVRILHGMKDDVVPWSHGVKLAEHISGDDVRVTLIKDGDHRLSGPDDLKLLTAMVQELIDA
jgi:pimeloyl-ACP methyl ester carboxylesterase